MPDSASDRDDRSGNEPPAGAGSIRVGSPFAEDPAPVAPPSPAETFLAWSPAGYTAAGAAAASWMVLAFAAAAAWWFPAGATVTTTFGCVLAILGLFSAYRWFAAAALPVHLALFVYSYLQIAGG